MDNKSVFRWADTPGKSLSLAFERFADGLWRDFSDGSWKADPTTLTVAFPELASPRSGLYSLDLDTPPADFPDGSYGVYLYDGSTTVVSAALAMTVTDGSNQGILTKLAPAGADGLVIPEPGGDPGAWTVPQKLLWGAFLRCWDVAEDGSDFVVRGADGSELTRQTVRQTETGKTLSPE